MNPPRRGLSRQTGSVINPFLPERIHAIGDTLVYVGTVTPAVGPTDGIRLEKVARYSREGLVYDRTAAATVRFIGDSTTSLLIPGTTSSSPVPIEPQNPVYQPIFAAPKVLQGMISDVDRLNRYLLENRARSPEGFALAVFSLSLLVMSCAGFLRLTRWPLFNALFVLFLLRGVFLIVRFLESDIGMEMRSLIGGERIGAQMPSFVFLILGAVFISHHLLFGRRGG